MNFYLSKYVFILLAALTVGSVNAVAQIPPFEPFPNSPSNRPEQELPKAVEENLIKMQIEESVEDHQELLERGDEALLLTRKIDSSLEKNGGFTSSDIDDLERIEKVVRKIRNELGGDSDDEAEEKLAKELAKKPDLTDAFRYLKSSTEKLVAELNKTSRHSISVAAIQTSNAVIKIARFLRLRN